MLSSYRHQLRDPEVYTEEILMISLKHIYIYLQICCLGNDHWNLWQQPFSWGASLWRETSITWFNHGDFTQEIAWCSPSLFMSTTDLNSGFSFWLVDCLTKVKAPSHLYSLPISGGRVVGFKLFTGVLALFEIPTASFSIRNRVAESIFDDVDHYTRSATKVLKCKPMTLKVLLTTGTTKNLSASDTYKNHQHTQTNFWPGLMHVCVCVCVCVLS